MSLFCSSQFLHGQNKSWEGMYHHEPSSKNIEIVKAEGGIMAKGWFSKKWRLFRINRKGIFVDKRGNRVELIHKDLVVFVPVRATRGYKMYRVRAVEKEIEQSYIQREAMNVPKTLEGLWYDNQQNVYLVVVETRDGIKVRLQNTVKWFGYHQHNRDDVFLSDEGHQYILVNNKLQYHHYGSQRLFNFYKISDSFDGY